MIKNYSKCRNFYWQFFANFSQVFFLSKLICLVTLFDRKLQDFKNSPKWTIFGIFN